ncbi:MAG: hypothetical protein D3913_14450 [Candidatus Electrothrix sp. LOE1_4_5]|nr:hypothetical protein [Candidatus Electrothrix gigas]
MRKVKLRKKYSEKEIKLYSKRCDELFRTCRVFFCCPLINRPLRQEEKPSVGAGNQHGQTRGFAPTAP